MHLLQLLFVTIDWLKLSPSFIFSDTFLMWLTLVELDSVAIYVYKE